MDRLTELRAINTGVIADLYEVIKESEHNKYGSNIHKSIIRVANVLKDNNEELSKLVVKK